MYVYTIYVCFSSGQNWTGTPYPQITCSKLWVTCDVCDHVRAMAWSTIAQAGYGGFDAFRGVGPPPFPPPPPPPVAPPERINLQVLCLTGEGLTLRLSPATLGSEVRREVAQRFPAKRGAQLVLHKGTEPLRLDTMLQQQSIVVDGELSCTYVPTNVYCAWRSAKGLSAPEFALEGVTRIENAPSLQLQRLPRTLQILTISGGSISNLHQVIFPENLENLTFGAQFNQSLFGVTLPGSLKSLTFGEHFNQGLVGVTLPSGIQNLSFGEQFNQGLEGVTLPGNLRNLTFGDRFSQPLERVTLPSTLESLVFWNYFRPEPGWSDVARKHSACGL